VWDYLALGGMGEHTAFPALVGRVRGRGRLNQHSDVVNRECGLRSGVVLLLRADDRLVEDVVDVLRARREGRTHCVFGVSRWGLFEAAKGTRIRSECYLPVLKIR
jgi:hypothetical protein